MATASNVTGLGVGALLGGVLAQVAPEPLRFAFWLDLGLVILAIAAVGRFLETMAVPEHPRLRISRPDLPPELRPAFIPAATAGFAQLLRGRPFHGCRAVVLGNVLHQPSHALAGAMVCGLLVISTVGQVTLAGRFGPLGVCRAGCAGLIAGMVLLAAGLAAKSLAIMIAATIVCGLGHGLCFREGLQAVNTRAPARRRGGVDSTYFIVLYIGISLPVVAEGIVAAGLGLQTAGIAFSIAVAVIVAIALARLVTARQATTSPTGARMSADVGHGIGDAWRSLGAELERQIRELDPDARVQTKVRADGLLRLEVRTIPSQRLPSAGAARSYEERRGPSASGVERVSSAPAPVLW